MLTGHADGRSPRVTQPFLEPPVRRLGSGAEGVQAVPVGVTLVNSPQVLRSVQPSLPVVGGGVDANQRYPGASKAGRDPWVIGNDNVHVPSVPAAGVGPLVGLLAVALDQM